MKINVWVLMIILFIPFVSSTSVWNGLTKGQADSLYCKIDGTCYLANLFVKNITVDGDVFNVSVVNYNVTGTITINGNINLENHAVIFSDGEYINASSFDDLNFYSDDDMNFYVGGEAFFDGDILPTLNMNYNLGSDTYIWDTFYIDDIIAAGDIKQEDNQKHYFGSSDDASIYYDGGDLVVTSDEVIDGSLDVADNFTGNQIYGGMWYTNYTATELNLAVDGQFYTLFMTNATHLNGFGTEGIEFNGNSNLTTQVAGLYQATYMATGDGQNNHVYHTSIFVNDDNQLNCDHQKKLAAGGDVITQTGTCFIDLEVGDKVSLRTADVGSTGTGNYYGANLDLVRVGD